MKQYLLPLLLTLTLLLSACGGEAAQPDDEDAAVIGESGAGDEDALTPPAENGVLAKVTAIDGDTVTVVKAEGNAGGAPSGKAPTGEAPEGDAGAQQPNGEPGEAPTGEVPAEGERPAAPEGEGQPGGPGGEMSFSGEEFSFTLSDDIAITRRDSGESAGVEEITVDSVLMLTMDGDSVTAITIWETAASPQQSKA